MCDVPINNERGAALATVVIMGLVIGILSFSTYKYADIRTKQTGHVSLRREAQYTAKAGVEATKFGLRNKLEDSLQGIVDSSGVAAGFEEGDLYFDIDTGTIGGDQTNALNRRMAKVSVEDVGMTSDGMRRRYKITSRSNYVDLSESVVEEEEIIEEEQTIVY